MTKKDIFHLQNIFDYLCNDVGSGVEFAQLFKDFIEEFPELEESFSHYLILRGFADEASREDPLGLSS